MQKIPRWSAERRARFIRRGSATGDPGTALRFRMVAKLSRGASCNRVAGDLGCAVSTVVRAKHRFLNYGPAGLLDRRAGNGKKKVDSAYLEQLRVILKGTPQDCGWARTNWTRELLALEMKRRRQPSVAACTMGRALARLGARQGSPKPFVCCPWPRRKRQRRLFELRCLVASATENEPVFYSDEVDVHLNPKIGRDWMLPGTRRYVATPGKNKKHYLAGALNAVTRKLTYAEGTSKCSALFCQLLWRLVGENKCARRIHLILDNYIIHKSKKTQKVLAQLGGRVALHFLPPYCPDDNRIERIWLDLHANVTRNHRRKTMPWLLIDVRRYLDARKDDACPNPSVQRILPVAA